MTHYIQFTSEDGSAILVEAAEEETYQPGVVQAGTGMGQNGHAVSLADSGDGIGRMRERGPLRAQGVHQLFKIVARPGTIAVICQPSEHRRKLNI